MILQLIFNILFQASIILMLAFSFRLIYQIVKFFHIAHAANMIITGYMTYYLNSELNFNLMLSVMFAIIVSVIITVCIELFIYKPLRKKEIELWQLLVVSLGVYIIIQNLFTLIFGNATISLRTWEVTRGIQIFGATISLIQLITIVLSFSLVFCTIFYLNKTTLGKHIKAVASNSELSQIFGINSDKIALVVFIFGSFISSLTGIFLALDTELNPSIGFNLFFYAIVAMIISGIGKNRFLIISSIILSTLQVVISFYFNIKWMDTVTYILLIVFLYFAPFGISGNNLKKSEI